MCLFSINKLYVINVFGSLFFHFSLLGIQSVGKTIKIMTFNLPKHTMKNMPLSIYIYIYIKNMPKDQFAYSLHLMINFFDSSFFQFSFPGFRL